MRTAKEWGRVAVSLPGWRWMPGMLNIGQSLRVVAPKLATCTGMYRGRVSPPDSGTADGWCRAWVINYDPDIDDQMCDTAPDPDDPATAGCLLAMLEGAGPRPYRRPGGLWVVATVPYMETYGHLSLPLGRACIAAAEALGRWPGGAE
jgi:hypothetical protein